MQIFHTDSAARRVDQSPGRQANGTTGNTRLLALNFDGTFPIDGPGDDGALLSFLPGLDLKLVLIASQLEGYASQLDELFLLVVYAQSVLWNLGKEISFSLTMPFLFGALFIYIGFFLEKTKQNWFIGIRTPWTLSSPEVWEKTHKLGGKLFKAAGVLSVLSVFFPAYAFLVVIALVIASAIATVIYSYLVYARLAKKGKPGKN